MIEKNAYHTFVQSPNFVFPDSETNDLPSFTTYDYQSLLIPETPEAYSELYISILQEINKKIKEINFSHSFYESTGMISITDSNFIKNILFIENKTNRNIRDIIFYNTDLLTLRSSYTHKFNRSLLLDLKSSIKPLSIEYYSNLDYYLVFCSQLINVSAHEILDIIAQNNPSLDYKIKDLQALISAVQRMINQRISYEIQHNNLDLNTIIEFLNQNKELLIEVEEKLKKYSSISL